LIARGSFGVGAAVRRCRWRSSLWTAVFFYCAFFASAAAASAAAPPYRYEEAQSKALNKAAPGEAFAAPFGLSFDSAGNLFVADTSGHEGAGVIDKFDSEDAFQAQLGAATLTGNFTNGVAVSDESGHVYVGDSNFSEVFVLDEAGVELSQWTGANTLAKSFGEGCCFVYTAVDNSPSASEGEIYVSTTQEAGKVYVFEAQGEDKEEGKFVRELEAPEGFEFGEGDGLGINQANGQVYVADTRHKVVDRFSAEGTYEASTQIKGISPSQPFAEPVAVAVDPATGNVFVVDRKQDHVAVIDEFGPSGELLTQIKETGEGEVLQRPVALAVQQSGPNAGELYVTDAGKKAIDVFAKENPEAPAIEAVGVQGLSGDRVSFLAEIDPHGSPTEYRFEYGRCATPTTCPESPYEHRVPEPDALLGFEDFKGHSSAPFQVKGLSASSTYHVRAIAHNALGEVIGEERMFTTQGPGGTLSLPDERSWELVSPPDKHAGVLSPQPGEGVIEAAADGGAIAYLANAPTEAAPEGYAGEVQVLSQRSASAWSSRDIASPHVGGTGSAAGVAPEYRLFAEDLSAAVLQPFGLFNPEVSAEASEQTPYLRTLGACTSNCYRPLVTAEAGFANVPAGTGFGEELLCEEDNGVAPKPLPVCGPRAQGASPDASHVVLRSAAPLSEGLPRNELYEWAGGQLKLVSVLAANEAGEELPAPTGPFIGEPLLGTGFGLSGPSARRAISSDGSRVFWESEATLYMRETAKGETLQVDAAEAGCPESECSGGAGRFEIASADGSRVFFTDKRRLTNDAGAEVGVPDLYECRIFTNGEGKLACQTTDLTPSEGGESAFVQGAVFGASEDGSTVYFVADGVLAGSGATRGNCKGNAEEQPSSTRCNLYELREGKAKLIAVLSGADAVDWTRAIENQPTRVSPSGRWLSFMSSLSLTGYDNHDAVSGRLDAEIFVYDAATEELSCASCDPSGARPAGIEYGQLESRESLALPATRGEWENKGWVAALPPHTDAIGPSRPSYQPRYLSDSGRLFFNSLDALVPEDVNATGDVYEHEPAGVGSCTQSGGCVSLISSGESPEASAFLDASESGDDVFILTAQRLTRGDVDSREDIYDAHVCSAVSPCLEPSAETPPACITESSCKAAPAPQPPAFGAPASETFQGPRNPAPPPAVKVKAPTRAERLAKALKSCRKRHPHARKRRVACERGARAKYAAKPKKTAKKKGQR
jgi:DNA-binding beta-propeller fold protein YncE